MNKSDTTLVDEPEAAAQVPAAVPGSGSRSEYANAEADMPEAEAADDPWEGIPAELLDGTHSYDNDSAGGCG
jgi:hypothetical protein